MARTANPSSSSGPSAGAAVPATVSRADVSPLVRRLLELDAGDHWVVSCYLKLEPRDRSRGKYLIKFKNRVRAALADAATRLGRGALDGVERDLERMRTRLDSVNAIPGGGVAMFACEPLGLFEEVHLPEVLRSRLVIDHSPLVRELVATAEEFGVVYCVAYDRTSARVFRSTAFECVEVAGIPAGDIARSTRFRARGASGGPGRGMAVAGEYGHNQRIAEEKNRHYATVAQRLFELTRAEPVRGIVLAGVGVEAKALVPYLHPYIQSLVLGAVRLQPKAATVAEIEAAVLKVRREASRNSERLLLAEVKEKRGAGWAVSGVEPTLEALGRGQVRTLLVDPDAALPGFRNGPEGTLSLRRDGEAAIPVVDVIDEAVEDALAQRSHVDVIESPELRGTFDGLAALLRFKGR